MRPLTDWTLSMDSVDSLDIVHGHTGQNPGSLGGWENVHGYCPLSPQTEWILSMDSVQSLHIDYGHIGQSLGSPDGLEKLD